MAVRKFLELSTAHLSPAARKLLEAEGGDVNLSVSPHGGSRGLYGWWLWAGSDRSDMEGVPEELIRVMDYALAQECEWICFDCDAEAITDLPTWEW
jgi:hypothetical protein